MNANLRLPRAPPPGAKLSLFGHEDGYRYQLWGTNLAAGTKGWRGQNAYIDARHRGHARSRTRSAPGKRPGSAGSRPTIYTFNRAWLTAAMMEQILLAWLKLLALDGGLARAEPKTLRYRVQHAAARLVRGGRRRGWKIAANWPWAEPITAGLAAYLRAARYQLTSTDPSLRPGKAPGGPVEPRHPVRQPGHRHTQTPRFTLSPRSWGLSAAASNLRE